MSIFESHVKQSPQVSNQRVPTKIRQMFLDNVRQMFPSNPSYSSVFKQRFKKVFNLNKLEFIDSVYKKSPEAYLNTDIRKQTKKNKEQQLVSEFGLVSTYHDNQNSILLSSDIQQASNHIDHPSENSNHLVVIISLDALRRCAGAGRAEPDLFLPGTARHGA